MSNGSNVPISVTITNGLTAIAGTATGTFTPPPIPLPGGHIKAGIFGTSDDGTGVYGTSHSGPGVKGESVALLLPGHPGLSDGVLGTSGKNGVHGVSSSSSDSGVWGENSGGGYGASGSTNSIFQPGPNVTAGVWGNNSGSGTGVKGTSSGGDGVFGFTESKDHAGVSASNSSGGLALWAGGDVEVTGNVRVNGDIVLANQDCAEDFEILDAGNIDLGSVVVIDSQGGLKRSEIAYDKRVAGVISGARDLRPGIILGRHQAQKNRLPVALVGKVYCKVDASREPIEVGDLLTTSPTPGHAMKAADPVKAFGAVIGKALRPLAAGQGLLPILVALQ
jgi:hypothetical protein